MRRVRYGNCTYKLTHFPTSSCNVCQLLFLATYHVTERFLCFSRFDLTSVISSLGSCSCCLLRGFCLLSSIHACLSSLTFHGLVKAQAYCLEQAFNSPSITHTGVSDLATNWLTVCTVVDFIYLFTYLTSADIAACSVGLTVCSYTMKKCLICWMLPKTPLTRYILENCLFQQYFGIYLRHFLHWCCNL